MRSPSIAGFVSIVRNSALLTITLGAIVSSRDYAYDCVFSRWPPLVRRWFRALSSPACQVCMHNNIARRLYTTASSLLLQRVQHDRRARLSWIFRRRNESGCCVRVRDETRWDIGIGGKNHYFPELYDDRWQRREGRGSKKWIRVYQRGDVRDTLFTRLSDEDGACLKTRPISREGRVCAALSKFRRVEF